MIEWLWEHLVLQRLGRIRAEGLQYQDVILYLTMAGACIAASVWILRKTGGQAAADEWEKGIRETSKLAEREGWHSVLQWHRKLGHRGAPVPAQKPQISTLSGMLFLVGVVLAVAMIAWATR